MDVPAKNIQVRSSYNLAGVSFSPAEVARNIQKHIPDFSITYEPDFRQAIADTWPRSIDDSVARSDWAWKHKYGLDDITSTMLENLRPKYS